MQNLLAGLLLILVAAIAAWQASPLSFGTLRHDLPPLERSKS